MSGVDYCIWHALRDVWAWRDICASWVCGRRLYNV